MDLPALQEQLDHRVVRERWAQLAQLVHRDHKVRLDQPDQLDLQAPRGRRVVKERWAQLAQRDLKVVKGRSDPLE